MKTLENRQHFSFDEYVSMAAQLLAEGRTTGPDQGPTMMKYARENFERMQRVSTNVQVMPEIRAAIESLPTQQTWVLIAEPWCGDCAQVSPALGALAGISPNVQLRIVLRDENPDLMDQHLTNGGRSIPMLLMFDRENDRFLGTWGPRTTAIQDQVNVLKAMDPRPPLDEFIAEIHRAYDADRTVSLQTELLNLLQGYSAIS